MREISLLPMKYSFRFVPVSLFFPASIISTRHFSPSAGKNPTALIRRESQAQLRRLSRSSSGFPAAPAAKPSAQNHSKPPKAVEESPAEVQNSLPVASSSQRASKSSLTESVSSRKGSASSRTSRKRGRRGSASSHKSEDQEKGVTEDSTVTPEQPVDASSLASRNDSENTTDGGMLSTVMNVGAEEAVGQDESEKKMQAPRQTLACPASHLISPSQVSLPRSERLTSPSNISLPRSEFLISPSQVSLPRSEHLISPSQISLPRSEWLMSPSQISLPPSVHLASPSQISLPPSECGEVLPSTESHTESRSSPAACQSTHKEEAAPAVDVQVDTEVPAAIKSQVKPVADKVRLDPPVALTSSQSAHGIGVPQTLLQQNSQSSSAIVSSAPSSHDAAHGKQNDCPPEPSVSKPQPVPESLAATVEEAAEGVDQKVETVETSISADQKLQIELAPAEHLLESCSAVAVRHISKTRDERGTSSSTGLLGLSTHSPLSQAAQPALVRSCDPLPTPNDEMLTEKKSADIETSSEVSSAADPAQATNSPEQTSPGTTAAEKDQRNKPLEGGYMPQETTENRTTDTQPTLAEKSDSSQPAKPRLGPTVTLLASQSAVQDKHTPSMEQVSGTKSTSHIEGRNRAHEQMTLGQAAAEANEQQTSVSSESKADAGDKAVAESAPTSGENGKVANSEAQHTATGDKTGEELAPDEEEHTKAAGAGGFTPELDPPQVLLSSASTSHVLATAHGSSDRAALSSSSSQALCSSGAKKHPVQHVVPAIQVQAPSVQNLRDACSNEQPVEASATSPEETTESAEETKDAEAGEPEPSGILEKAEEVREQEEVTRTTSTPSMEVEQEGTAETAESSATESQTAKILGAKSATHFTQARQLAHEAKNFKLKSSSMSGVNGVSKSQASDMVQAAKATKPSPESAESTSTKNNKAEPANPDDEASQTSTSKPSERQQFIVKEAVPERSALNAGDKKECIEAAEPVPDSSHPEECINDSPIISPGVKNDTLLSEGRSSEQDTAVDARKDNASVQDQQENASSTVDESALIAAETAKASITAASNLDVEVQITSKSMSALPRHSGDSDEEGQPSSLKRDLVVGGSTSNISKVTSSGTPLRTASRKSSSKGSVSSSKSSLKSSSKTSLTGSLYNLRSKSKLNSN